MPLEEGCSEPVFLPQAFDEMCDRVNNSKMTRGVSFLGVIGIFVYLLGLKASAWRLYGPARTFLLGHVVFQLMNILVILCQSGYAKNDREANPNFDKICFDTCVEEGQAWSRQERWWVVNDEPYVWKSSVGAAGDCRGCDWDEKCKLAKR